MADSEYLENLDELETEERDTLVEDDLNNLDLPIDH